MSKNNQLGHIARFGPAIKNSLVGLAAAYKYEIAFRQYSWMFIFLLPTAVYIASSVAEFAVLILSVVAILVAELLNTAVEAAIDRISLEQHELSGKAKDLGSAAVFVALTGFVLVWGYKIFTMLV